MLNKNAKRLADDKTDSPQLYKVATPFAEVKTDTLSGSQIRIPEAPQAVTCFPKIKTDSQELYKVAHRNHRATTRLLHALCMTKWTLKSFTLHLRRRYAVVKTDSPKIYKASTHFTDVKTDSPKLYKIATRFTEVKMDSPKL